MKATNAMRIFLVDDDEIFQIMLSEYLRARFDYQIECFASGEDFLPHLHKRPDIVLLDHNLLLESGLDILKRIKGQYPSIQVLAVSGQDNLSITMEIMQNGAFSYVAKSENTFEEISEKILEMREHAEAAQLSKNETAGFLIGLAALIAGTVFSLFQLF